MEKVWAEIDIVTGRRKAQRLISRLRPALPAGTRCRVRRFKTGVYNAECLITRTVAKQLRERGKAPNLEIYD